MRLARWTSGGALLYRSIIMAVTMSCMLSGASAMGSMCSHRVPRGPGAILGFPSVIVLASRLRSSLVWSGRGMVPGGWCDGCGGLR